MGVQKLSFLIAVVLELRAMAPASACREGTSFYNLACYPASPTSSTRPVGRTTSVVAAVMEVRALSGGEKKTAAPEAALDNIKHSWELFRDACHHTDKLVESTRQCIGLDSLVDAVQDVAAAGFATFSYGTDSDLLGDLRQAAQPVRIRRASCSSAGGGAVAAEVSGSISATSPVSFNHSSQVSFPAGWLRAPHARRQAMQIPFAAPAVLHGGVRNMCRGAQLLCMSLIFRCGKKSINVHEAGVLAMVHVHIS